MAHSERTTGRGPGVYKGQLTVTAEGGHEKAFPLELEVLPATLPAVEDWSLLVEIFPNPYAVADAHGLELWSDAYWAQLKKLLTLARESGVNAQMTYLAPVVWADTDPEKSMLRPIRKADGSWAYDFRIIDQYIELGLSCGLDREIKFAFPRAPIKDIHYFDEARNTWVTEEALFRSPKYDAFWQPLITALAAHLKEKGWFEKSYLYFDEPKGSLRDWLDMAEKVAPDFKIAVAGGDAGRYLSEIEDASLILHEEFEPDSETLLQREKDGLQTTFYICSFPKAPNTLAWDKPVHGAWMGWYAASRHYTGFLRWALNNWKHLEDDPFMNISTGDFQLTYPGPRSSIRLERLREGFQDYEKIRLVRQKLESMGTNGQDGLNELNAVLKAFEHNGFKSDYGKQVHDGKAVLEKLSREIF